MVKALIFDFFDVIRTDAYKAWLATHHITHEGPYFDASHQQDIGAITSEQFLEKLSELTGREVVVSSEVGMVKPSPEIFNLTLRKLALEPSEAIFIDDSMRHVEGAQKVGISSIQFMSAQQLKRELSSLGIAV